MAPSAKIIKAREKLSRWFKRFKLKEQIIFGAVWSLTGLTCYLNPLRKQET